MPHKRTPDGGWVRLAYRPADYTVSEKELDRLRSCPCSFEEELGKPDGLFANYDRVRELVRDGGRWVVLRERSRGFCLEVELRRDDLGELRPVPPEEAWRIARQIDKRSSVPIGFEGEPPPGVVDPAD